MNVFQLTYDARLKSWYNLRHRIEEADTETKCVEVDAWWQQAPLVNHYLHQSDTQNWPGPWDLLVDNTYCTMARGLGMYYTLLLTGVKAIDFVLGKDDNDEDVSLVIVDGTFIMNYYPDTVMCNKIEHFTIIQYINMSQLVINLK